MSRYAYLVSWNPEDGEYVATCGVFPGLSGLGRTAKAAVAELDAALETAVAALIEDGEPVPDAPSAETVDAMRREYDFSDVPRIRGKYARRFHDRKGEPNSN